MKYKDIFEEELIERLTNEKKFQKVMIKFLNMVQKYEKLHSNDIENYGSFLRDIAIDMEKHEPKNEKKYYEIIFENSENLVNYIQFLKIMCINY